MTTKREVSKMEENLTLGGKEKKPRKKESRRSFGQFVTDIFNEYKNEYQKIIWPNRQELIKSTILVIIITAIFALIIYVLDVILRNAHGLFIGLFS